MRIIIKDSNIYTLKGNEHMLHLATLERGFQTFYVMLCLAGPQKNQCFIEEYVPTSVSYSDDIFGNFKFIDNDELALELTRFAEEHMLTDIRARAQEMVETGLGRIVFG